MYVILCDECEKPAVGTVSLMTGRVWKDGKDIGQNMDFCEDHTPDGRPLQPKNCTRVEFYWPGLK